MDKQVNESICFSVRSRHVGKPCLNNIRKTRRLKILNTKRINVVCFTRMQFEHNFIRRPSTSDLIYVQNRSWPQGARVSLNTFNVHVNVKAVMGKHALIFPIKLVDPIKKKKGIGLQSRPTHANRPILIEIN